MSDNAESAGADPYINWSFECVLPGSSLLWDWECWRRNSD